MINITKAEEAFADYVRNYDPENGKVRLKIIHTYHVEKTAEKIAMELGLGEEDVLLAKLIGLLHDIGRFEQVRRFGDFRDHLTVDHAKLGADLLEEGLLNKFVEDRQYDDIILKAIRMHNRFAIDEELDERTLLHAKIIRDADKVDIFRVRITDPIIDVQACTEQEMENGIVSKEAYEAFMEHRCLDREKIISVVDGWICGAALIFDINFRPSMQILLDEHYVDRMIDRIAYKNEDTKAKMEVIKQAADRYMIEKVALL